MSRERIYPPRHAICAQVSIEVADALVKRARTEQVPQRIVVESALRQYLGTGARQPALVDHDRDSVDLTALASVATQINIEEIAAEAEAEILARAR